MATATLTSKGQLVIPKAVRDHLGVHPGDQVDFVIREDGEVVVRPAILDIKELRGLLHRPGRKPVSLADMEQAIRRRASESR